ncbi:MAG TPA: FAD-dependent oxidoreductase, partial [Tangfeifania sp.]|nr:FAD-dependent oxidoreductase [Tangfeifania sp.]
RVVQVALGFKNWQGLPLNAFGGLVPSVEQRRILGVLFLSSFLKNKAPENGALLSVFLGGIRQPEMIELSDEEIKQVVKEEVSEMMQLENYSPDLVKVFRYNYAIPQYGFESEEKLKAISEIETENPGLILAGNVRDGIGIADRINQGRTIAGQIAKEAE